MTRRPSTRRPRGWLILFGNYGVGKTHLAAAIANEALRRHFRVLFTIVPDLLDHLRSTFGPSSEIEYDTRFETIRDAPQLYEMLLEASSQVAFFDVLVAPSAPVVSARAFSPG